MALCIERSTPSANASWFSGDANVLSSTDSTPRARHAAATVRMSTQRNVGLVGDSNHTTRVRSLKTGPSDASSSSDTKRVVMPNRDSRSCSRCSVPP